MLRRPLPPAVTGKESGVHPLLIDLILAPESSSSSCDSHVNPPSRLQQIAPPSPTANPCTTCAQRTECTLRAQQTG
eukprot:3054261-Pyramimonas_sp.AAC.1